MHQLSNSSICSLRPWGPQRRGAGRQRGSCPTVSAPAPLSLAAILFFFFSHLVGGKSSEFRRGSTPAGSLALPAPRGV